MNSPCIKPVVQPGFGKQRGISLIESLISLLLIAIMGAGLAMVSSRSLLTQRHVTTQNLAVMQMREHMKTAKPGDTLEIGFGSGQVEVTYDLSPVSISISNEVAERSVTVYANRNISADSESWLGGAVSIGPGI